MTVASRGFISVSGRGKDESAAEPPVSISSFFAIPSLADLKQRPRSIKHSSCPAKIETNLCQVVDLESCTRSGSSAGGNGSGGGIGGAARSPSPPKLTLLREAEKVLVESWQAFGAANAAVLELVELQNPLPSPTRGGGPSAVAVEGEGGMLLRRYLRVEWDWEAGSDASRPRYTVMVAVLLMNG